MHNGGHHYLAKGIPGGLGGLHLMGHLWSGTKYNGTIGCLYFLDNLRSKYSPLIGNGCIGLCQLDKGHLMESLPDRNLLRVRRIPILIRSRSITKSLPLPFPTRHQSTGLPWEKLKTRRCSKTEGRHPLRKPVNPHFGSIVGEVMVARHAQGAMHIDHSKGC